MKTFLLRERTVSSNWKSMLPEKKSRLVASANPCTMLYCTLAYHPSLPVNSSVRTDPQMQILLHTPICAHTSTTEWWTTRQGTVGEDPCGTHGILACMSKRSTHTHLQPPGFVFAKLKKKKMMPNWLHSPWSQRQAAISPHLRTNTGTGVQLSIRK